MHDQIAADHRQSSVGALEADMLCAISIDDHIAGVVAVADRGAGRAAVAGDQAQGAIDRRVAGIGGDSFAGTDRNQGCQR